MRTTTPYAIWTRQNVNSKLWSTGQLTDQGPQMSSDFFSFSWREVLDVGYIKLFVYTRCKMVKEMTKYWLDYNNRLMLGISWMPAIMHDCSKLNNRKHYFAGSKSCFGRWPPLHYGRKPEESQMRYCFSDRRQPSACTCMPNTHVTSDILDYTYLPWDTVFTICWCHKHT